MKVYGRVIQVCACIKSRCRFLLQAIPLYLIGFDDYEKLKKYLENSRSFMTDMELRVFLSGDTYVLQGSIHILQYIWNKAKRRHPSFLTIKE